MKATFSIGEGLAANLPSLINTRLLVQANSGAGKSWCLRRILEQTHGAVQQLVIDPEGEFASLRERFDYVLAAKQHGDTLADPRSAKLLAERLLELGVSAILDIYEPPADLVERARKYYRERFSYLVPNGIPEVMAAFVLVEREKNMAQNSLDPLVGASVVKPQVVVGVPVLEVRIAELERERDELRDRLAATDELLKFLTRKLNRAEEQIEKLEAELEKLQ